jgi:hypothetical protein
MSDPSGRYPPVKLLTSKSKPEQRLIPFWPLCDKRQNPRKHKEVGVLSLSCCTTGQRDQVTPEITRGPFALDARRYRYLHVQMRFGTLAEAPASASSPAPAGAGDEGLVYRGPCRMQRGGRSCGLLTQCHQHDNYGCNCKQGKQNIGKYPKLSLAQFPPRMTSVVSDPIFTHAEMLQNPISRLHQVTLFVTESRWLGSRGTGCAIRTSHRL